jgi:hypothetical protein
MTNIYNKHYSGMFYVFCIFLHACCHVLHNFKFYGGKTGHSNGKSLANHHLEEHHLANGDVSMQGNTSLEGKQKLHRMGNHSLYKMENYVNHDKKIPKEYKKQIKTFQNIPYIPDIYIYVMPP